jgi:hypothetical protein
LLLGYSAMLAAAFRGEFDVLVAEDFPPMEGMLTLNH